MKYKLWNKTDALITPTGKVFSPAEVFEKYPASAIEGFDYIISDSPVNMAVFMQYDQTVEMYKDMGLDIPEGLTKNEVVTLISNFQPEEPKAVSAYDRIAAALEFNNLLMLEDSYDI